MANVVYPFSAIVGQERLKRALVLCAVDPEIGGVLIRGEKGTAKSTAVRAIASLLPDIEVTDGCAFSCPPAGDDNLCPDCRVSDRGRPAVRRRVRVVDLPLNTTQDRLLGGIDFEGALRAGRYRLQPGLLAEANRGFLYVDEVNLLDDFLADALLDAAGSGRNVVEREGISLVHPARFVLVGTMNPEEGELRPQFLDRFGLCVNVTGIRDENMRLELLRRREAFDANPGAFSARWEIADKATARGIARAREILSAVRVDARIRSQAAALCREAGVAGHRGDIALVRAARAIAALDARKDIDETDVEEAAGYVLSHRTRTGTPDQQPPARRPPSSRDHSAAPDAEQDARDSNTDPRMSSGADTQGQGGERPSGRPSGIEDRIFEVGASFRVRRFPHAHDRTMHGGVGRRTRTRAGAHCGRQISSRIAHDVEDLSIAATLRAAAPYQRERREGRRGQGVIVHQADYRRKVREKRIGNYVILAVDASGSMGARRRMIATKGAIQSLLLDTYRMRDKVALVTFRKSEAELVLPPGNSVVRASRLLARLPTGGRTPLAAGIAKAYECARNCLLRNQAGRPIVLLITDARPNQTLHEGASPVEELLALSGKAALDRRITWIVVDTEPAGFASLGLARTLAGAIGGHYYKIEELKADDIVEMVKEHTYA
ncbi:MAG: VWA domain-containing protein [Chitinivibrionales bacterium]|nr:VWA domain-containing protein [Chitinivibrionales bacterium]